MRLPDHQGGGMGRIRLFINSRISFQLLEGSVTGLGFLASTYGGIGVSCLPMGSIAPFQLC